MSNEPQHQLKTLQQRVDAKLETYLPAATRAPQRLHAAMRYAVQGGGKRVRPVLVYATGIALGIPLAHLDACACATELIHAYSLVHDDLPAMDDDDLRRGRPTCHIAFDDATAILAGDALQALAFEILARNEPHASPQTCLQMIHTLGLASGSNGMAGGQAIDLAAVDCQLDLPELENMHRHKTGALIEACVRLAALNTELSTAQHQSLQNYAYCIGLAFQVQDDILDVIVDTETLGKTQGADIARNKPTFVSLLGLQAAQHKAAELSRRALHALEGFDSKADLLRYLAEYIVKRRH